MSDVLIIKCRRAVRPERLRELRRFLMVLISNNYKSNKKHHLIRTSDSSGDAFLLCIYYIINDCYPDIQVLLL